MTSAMDMHITPLAVHSRSGLYEKDFGSFLSRYLVARIKKNKLLPSALLRSLSLLSDCNVKPVKLVPSFSETMRDLARKQCEYKNTVNSSCRVPSRTFAFITSRSGAAYANSFLERDDHPVTHLPQMFYDSYLSLDSNDSSNLLHINFNTSR